MTDPTGYIKLKRAPEWVLQFPQCSACMVDLETDGDGWICPVCGTSWSTDANDGDVGELYESWSGEKLDGPALGEHEAMQAGVTWERAIREKTLASIRTSVQVDP